jgi:hypothetical protein
MEENNESYIKYKVGDTYVDGLEVLHPDKRKKVLLLSDDLRTTSGIATMSKEFIFNTFHRFNWVQLGASIQHPEEGKEIDFGADVRTQSGVEGASLKIIPSSGYGNDVILRNLIARHNPDAILHFTDPRFWRWLYDMEAEVRENIPILYYNIWDNLPTPDYNRNYYASCDGLFCISKQTYGIVNRVLDKFFTDELNIVKIQ